ncbi:MAG: C4-dicarboxylate ABC transporter substrate-binding protein, partial [Pseudomonadota bacterium]
MTLPPLGRLAAAAFAGALSLAGAAAQAQNLQMASLGPASPTTVLSIAVSEILKDELDVRVQLATGSPATRQAVDAANQRLDLFTTAVSINHYMKNRLRMYKDMEAAPELFGELRAIMNYPLGAYHVLVWADSGIESFGDIAGKTVFTGPPAGAARTVGRLLLEGSGGLTPGE